VASSMPWRAGVNRSHAAIEHRDRGAVGNECFDESAPDEPGTAKDERRHGDSGGPYLTCRLMSP